MGICTEGSERMEEKKTRREGEGLPFEKLLKQIKT